MCGAKQMIRSTDAYQTWEKMTKYRLCGTQWNSVTYIKIENKIGTGKLNVEILPCLYFIMIIMMSIQCNLMYGNSQYNKS